jgi:hypothetical protein
MEPPGDMVPAGETIASLLHAYPNVDADGRLVFVGVLSNGCHFVWHDDEVVWVEPTCSSGPLGERCGAAMVDDDLAWVYDTRVFEIALDCIRRSSSSPGGFTELCVGTADPENPGVHLTTLKEPRMAADGTTLFYASSTFSHTRLYRWGDGGIQTILASPEQSAPDPSGTARQITHVLPFLNTSDDGSYGIIGLNLAADGQIRPAMVTMQLDAGGVAGAASPYWLPSGWNLDATGLSINNSGRYAVTGRLESGPLGLITGQYGSPGTEAIVAGDTLDGLPASLPLGVALNNDGRIMHLWYYQYFGVCGAALFMGDVDDPLGTSKVLLKTGDDIVTDRGTLPTVILRWTSSNCGPNIQAYGFGDGQDVYMSVDYDDGGAQQAIVRLDIEPCEWDLDCDEAIGVTDLVTLILAWGNPYNVEDLVNMILAWGPCP